MDIKLKRLQLTNFRGCENLTVDFTDNTEIRGDNKTGKTRLFDAFTYLISDKNSKDKKDFQIKMIQPDGEFKHQIESEVSGILEIDGKPLQLKKVFKEKWQKKRGEETPEMTGHTTDYFFDEVPVSMGDYQKRIADILPESLFKLITNPMYFNSLEMESRRKIVEDLAGGIDEQAIIDSDPEFKKLMDELSGKTFDDFRAKIASEKRTIKEEIAGIPVRVDEVEKSKPEPVDEKQVNKEISSLQDAIKEIDSAITPDQNSIDEFKKSRNNLIVQINSKTDRMATIKKSLAGIPDPSLKEKQELTGELLIKNARLTTVKNFSDVLAREIDLDEKALVDLRNSWQQQNAKTPEYKIEDVCFACGRPFTDDDKHTTREQQLSAFNKAKQSELEKISENGKRLSSDINTRKEQLKTYLEERDKLTLEIADINEKIHNLGNGNESEPVMPEEFTVLESEVKSLESELEKLTMPEIADIDKLKAEKVENEKKISELRSSLKANEIIDRANARIQELNIRHKKLGADLSDLEKKEFTMLRFSKKRTESIENTVNGMFRIVKFRMFQTQINGQEVPCCDAMQDGVPWSDLNDGGKIQVGLDIINTICEKKGVTAPIFIDNRESVTIIPEMNSQIINLYKDENFKTLTII